MKNNNEKGSYTIEACIVIPLFMMGIMLIYSLVNVLLLENIVQNAACNMAQEAASYTYIFDRAGLIFEPVYSSESKVDVTVKAASDTASDVKTLLSQVSDVEGTMNSFLKGGEMPFKDTLSDIKEDGSTLAEQFKDGNWKKLLLEAGKDLAAGAVNATLGVAAEKIYEAMLPEYLPDDLETFKRIYRVNGDFDFSGSQFLSDGKSICVRITCKVQTPFSSVFGIGDMTISKTAVSAAWISSNANK